MTTPRLAHPQDAATLARIHAAGWRESYQGQLPAEVIAMAAETRLLPRWLRSLTEGGTRVAIAGDLGFAEAGPQRADAWAARGFPGELHAIYLLRAAQGRGLGRALMTLALGPAPQPFTVLVLETNAGAHGFYEALGGRHLATIPEQVFGHPVQSRVYGWEAPVQLSR
jgi:GNAT superfamily N-acetyltransferase